MLVKPYCIVVRDNESFQISRLTNTLDSKLIVTFCAYEG